MWGDTGDEGGEAGVELQGAVLLEGLGHHVHGALVGHCAVRVGLHLLDLGLDVVEGQTAGGGEEAGDGRGGCGVIRLGTRQQGTL